MEEDEVAIVGAGCRFPGADNLDEFWRVLVNGENHVRDIPESRWNNAAFYDEDPNVPGKTYVTKAGLLSSHDKWDNRLFGISEVEASRMDPQQRYVLECVHMAMEDGGFTRKQMSGSKTGVIIGCMNDDYSAMANYDLADVGGYNATGTSTSVISARVSYVYNLHGTCLTLDTACSSALVAIHLASQAIRTGDCDMMICGGVNSILSPDIYIALCKARMMSATGQCFSFCDTADGYARGEGCGIVILKGLKAARRDGNKIWATIKTGSNQDGCTTKPITAPSGDQQMKLLKRVYDRYQFDPSEIQYIEAHGTGTPRGDPTELNALGQFFSSARDKQSDHLLVGSVKSNIGHTESAAGIAGLIKVLLMMNNGKYVPSLHVKADKSNVNSKIKLSEYRLDIPTSVTEWPTNKNGQRHACLNSFGFGGTNTHAIITLCESIETKESPEQDTKLPICLSGVDQDALKLNLSQFHDDLYHTEAPLHDVAVTSWQNRDIFTYRTLVFGNDRKSIQKECTVKVERVSELSPKKEHNKVFVYCGVGTTWTGMCRELMQHVKVFREVIDEIDHYLYPLTHWKMAEKFMSETNYEDPFLNHIAIFCVQVALTEVWKSFGIVPDKIIGQSVGEVAAAYAAKCLSLEESVNVIYYRSLILAQQSEGSMSVVGNVDVSKVEELCSRYEDKVCVAVYSSPAACTISGAKEELNMVTENLKNDVSNKNLFVRELKVKCAYHSPMLEGCTDEIITKIDETLASIQADMVERVVPMFSTVTCFPATRDELRTGQYWATNIRQPVRFMQCIKAAFEEDKNNVYLEIGPRPVLKAHIGNIFERNDKIDLFPSMLANKEIQCLYGSLSGLFEAGIDLSLSDILSANKRRITRIPRYVFNKTGELFIPNKCKAYMSGAKNGSASHMYVQTSKSATETLFRIVLNEESTPFVFEHFLSEKIIVPGATYVEAGFHIGLELLRKPTHMLSVGFSFEKTFTPTVGRQNELQVKIKTRNEDDCLKFNVENNSSILANGSVQVRTKNEKQDFDIGYIKAICNNFRSKQRCYDALRQFNFRYGESLSLIQEAWVSETGKQCLVEIQLPEKMTKDLVRTHFHPAAIDATFQIFGIIVRESLEDAFAVPKGVDSVVINRSLEDRMFGYAEEIRRTVNSTHYNAILLTENGTVIAEIENFYTKIITSETIEDKSLEYEQKWTERETFKDSHHRPSRIVLISNKLETSWINKLKDEVEVIEQRGLDFELLTKDVNDNTSVIYHVGGRNCKNTDINVLEAATERFSDVQNILISNQNTGHNFQLTVITENTQACPGRDQYDYEGSELWGLIRSAVHEGFYGRVRLIDIDPDKMDVSMLLSALSTEFYEDLAMSGQKAFQVRLTSELNFENIRRQISVKPSDILSVHSMSSNSVNNPYLLITEVKKGMTGSVSITIDSFACHNESLYIPVVGDVTKSEQLLQNDQEDNQVVMIEGRGKERDTKRDVFFLHPLKAGTAVNIPKDHVFDAKDFVFYKEGCLILMNLMVHVASAIENGKDVAVLTHFEDEDFGSKCFRYLMKDKQCNVQFYTRKDIQVNESIHEEKTLFIATTSSVEYWNLIVKSFPQLENVFTLSSFMPDNILLWIKHNFMDIQIKVISTFNVLSGRKISEALPSIKKCIQAGCLEPVSKENNFILKLPMKALELRRDIEDVKLKCYCSPRRLFRSDSSYVVIGGLTGLGWELLQMMAEMGAKTLITMSRRAPTEKTRKAINQLQDDYDCRILPMQVDICDIDSVKQTFRKIGKDLPDCPIRGIFQGAGVVSDSILQNLDKGKVTNVMRPKVQGTWNLHVASLNLPLDYFVIHSSIVSVLGNPGQCNYAAANSFLDSFALHRRSMGLPAQSINWGALEIGMATESSELKESLRQKGFNLVTKEKVREYFTKAIVSDSTNTVFADIEWEKLLSISTFALQAPVKSHEFQKVSIGSKAIDKGDTRLDLDEFHKLNNDEKEVKVKSLLVEIVHLVLVIDKESLNDSTRLTDIGIDSMAAMSLSNAIDETFGYREAVVTLLSEETTLSTICRNIIQSYFNTEMSDEKASYNKSDNLSEFTHIFASRHMTFMQKDVLDKCAKKGQNPYLLSVVDIEVTGHKHPMSVWKRIIIHSLKLNQEFGKRYLFSERGEISVETTSVNEAHLSIRKISVEEFEESQQYDIRQNINFDLHNSLPLCFQVAEVTGKTMVRLILHKVAFDMKGLTMFCKDLENTAESIIKDKELPALRPYVDIPLAVEEAILPRMNQLKSYWKTYLDCDIRPITFGPSLKDVDGNFCQIDHVDLPSSVVSKIKKYIGKVGISLYEFIMSLYQLYLYIGSGSTLITIGTAADMRFHVPVLNNILTRCVNYIPILADIQERETVEEFIKRNSTQLSSTTRNGAYPGSLILQNIKSKEMQIQVFRHTLSMNDMSGMQGAADQNTGSAYQIRRILHSRPTRETFMYVKYDLKREWIKLELGYNSKICGHIGKSFSSILLSLADHALKAPELSVKELKQTVLDDEMKKIKAEIEKEGIVYADMSKMQMKLDEDQLPKTPMEDKTKAPVQRSVTNVLYDDTNKMMNILNNERAENRKKVNNKDMDFIKHTNAIANEPRTCIVQRSKDILVTGVFNKQTSHGWDHKVDVKLIRDGDKHVVLEWGKDRRIRKKTNKTFDLNSVNKIIMRKMNDMQSIIILSNEKTIILKTPDRKQAEQWMNQLQKALVLG